MGGCGCKKKKTQETNNVSQSQVFINETKVTNQEPPTILTPDQQQQVDAIIEKINLLNKK